MPKNKKDSSLGKSLIRAHRKRSNFVVKDGYRHTSDLSDGRDFGRLNLRSVTEQTSLDDFLDKAALAENEFNAEFADVKLVEQDESNGILSEKEKALISSAQDKNKEILCIPRRPQWDQKTTKEVLDAMEKESFLQWRRKLALLQEEEHIYMTPFEKNLEVWRQLWRVIERSDLVVQIVDARNPLLFRCPDLEAYVTEVDEKKSNMLLLNKADYLTEQQRKCWCDYFDKLNIKIAFFSALEQINRPDEISKEPAASEGLGILNTVNSAAGANLPPSGELIRSPIGVGSRVWAMKNNLLNCWFKGTITNVIEGKNGEKLYKVQLDNLGHTRLNLLLAKYLAYENNASVIIPVGTRVIARYTDSTGLHAHYAGIIAEPAEITNCNRYLVFFDTGCAQYVKHEDTYVVCTQSADVADDIHDNISDYVRGYLQIYPELPMVKLAVDQYVKTEYNFEWFDSKVLEVDCSMVKILFLSSQMVEWIYRGSTRIKPLKNELDEDESSINESSENVDNHHFKNSPKILTREDLVSLFKSVPQYRSTTGVSTIGLVGYPNVGKSSTINAILMTKKVSVSATPGKTKHFQTFIIEQDLCLCDCPGLVFPNFVSTKAEMVINGILPIDQLTNWVQPVSLVTSLIPKHVLESTYSILIPVHGEDRDPSKPTAEEFLNAHGYNRGFMTQRGLPDNARSARYILKDFVNGKLLYCHAPPGIKQEDYHQFSDVKPKKMTSKEKQDNSQENQTLSEADKKFFLKTSGIHVKGKMSKDSQSNEICEKPWRKHNNKNKKEKLRRVYKNPYE